MRRGGAASSWGTAGVVAAGVEEDIVSVGSVVLTRFAGGEVGGEVMLADAVIV